MTLTKKSLCGLAWLGLLSVACGDDAGNSLAECGTESAPAPVALRDVSPAPSTSVTNSGIVHRFTVVGIQAIFPVSLVVTAEHTAGTPVPNELLITPHTRDNEVTYEVSPLEWSVAPGHVVIQDSGLYETSSGCIYEFPAPLFEYDIVP